MTKPSLPRPAPGSEPELESYWAAAAQQRIGLGRCTECQHLFLPPQRICPQCWSSGVATEHASGRGTVEAVSVVYKHASPAFRERLPYAVVYVRLDEGVALTAAMVGIEPEQVTIGTRVSAVYEETDDGTRIPLFTRETT